MSNDNNTQKGPETSKNSNKSLASYFNKDNKVAIIIVAVVLILIGGAIVNSTRDKAATTISSKIIENAINSQSDTKVDINNDGSSITFKNDQGQTGTYDSKKTVSADFPSEIPLYGGQEILGNIRSESPDGIGWVLTTNSTDSLETVNNFFKSNLSGWTKGTDFSTSETVSAMYTKGNLQFSYVLSAGTDKKPVTGITYSVIQKP